MNSTPSLGEQFGVVENISGNRERGLSWAYERYSPIAVFLLGGGDRLNSATEEAVRHHTLTQVPLYSNIDAFGWTRIDEQVSFREDWRPTLDGRFLEGDDLEIAAEADNDARLALALETIVERLIPTNR